MRTESIAAVVLSLLLFTVFEPGAKRAHSIVLWVITFSFLAIALGAVATDLVLFRWYQRRLEKRRHKS